MKKLYFLLFFICILSVNSVDAQNTFAPAGSEWYHNMEHAEFGVFHDFYGGDTVIAGVACRKVERVAQVADPYFSMGLHVYNLPTLCFYNTADTVFVYNDVYGMFTPVYIFNVSPGQQICLPALRPDPESLISVITDSTFCFIVDSVKMVTYDTAQLKTVYTHVHAYDTPGKASYNYGSYFDTMGIYAERIGDVVGGGLLPVCRNCANLADYSLENEGQIRCYNDPGMSIKQVPGICGIPPTSVNDIYSQLLTVNIFPNPAESVLHISLGDKINGHLSLHDVTGKEVTVQSFLAAQTVDVDVSKLAAGFYLLRVAAENNRVVYKKVTVAR